MKAYKCKCPKYKKNRECAKDCPLIEDNYKMNDCEMCVYSEVHYLDCKKDLNRQIKD